MDWATLAGAIATLRATLPAGLMRRLAEEISAWGEEDWGLRRLHALRVAPAPAYRHSVERLLAIWHADCPSLSPQAVSFGLLCAGAGGAEREAVELVWTGVDV